MPFAFAVLLAVNLNPAILTVPIFQPTQQDVFIEKLINCESMGSTTVKVLDTDGFYSYGVGQFHLATWINFGKKFGTTKENIYDGDLQRVVIKDMLNRGLWRQWTNCAKPLLPYPSSE